MASEPDLRPHDLADGTTVYDSPAAERRWGYRCGACGSFDTAMDTMGRIACTDCPNRRKPDEWDAAHE